MADSFKDSTGNIAQAVITAAGGIPVELISKLAGESITLDRIFVEQQSSYIAPMTASGSVKGSPGRFFGLVCTTSSTLIVRIWDNSAASGTKILDSLTLVAGDIKAMPNGPVNAATAIYLEFVSGSGTVTPLYQ